MVSDENKLKNIHKLWEFSKEKNITIRIAVSRPCNKEWENIVKKETEMCGNPLFFSEKERGTVEGCYMPYIRGAITWDGNFIACPSVTLVEENNGKIPESFKLCHINNLEEWILNNPPHDLGFRCSYCNCGFENNSLVCNLLNEQEDVDFV
jgi:hypothetical protein